MERPNIRVPCATGCHPTCFAQHCLRVDLAPTGRAKCKVDGTEIPKGAIRLLIGYKKESTIYKVENAHLTIFPSLLTLAGRTSVTVHGLGDLSLGERAYVERTLFDGGSGSGGGAKRKKRPAVAPAAKASPAPKKPKPTSRRKARAVDACGSDDGELVD
jgi:hypothetical protein